MIRAQHRDERAQDYHEERCLLGAFRCDRCTNLWPLPFTEQDGARLCRRCADAMGPNETQAMFAREIAMNAANPQTALDYPPTGAYGSVSAVTRISPTSVDLARGGASQTVTLTGVNFTTADTVAASSGSITVNKVVDSATQITLTISAAGGMTPGDYNLTFNSDTLTPRGILKVR